MAGHVQQGLQAGGGLHRAAHRTGTNQTGTDSRVTPPVKTLQWC